MGNWRPKNWGKNPCEDCPDIQLDYYGYLCDLACGKHTAYLNREAGADAILEALRDAQFPYGNSQFVGIEITEDGQLFINVKS